MTTLKTVEEVEKLYHNEQNVMSLEEIITQDRQDILAVLREGVDNLPGAIYVDRKDVQALLQETLGEGKEINSIFKE